MSLVITAILAIVGLLGFGYYQNEVAPRWQMVGRVNETVFSATDLVKELKFFSGALGIQLKEQPTFIFDALGELQNDELIRREALRLGLSVPPGDIDESIRQRFSPEGDAQDEKQVQKRYQEWLREAGLSDEDYRHQLEAQKLRQKLREHLNSQILDPQEQVHLLLIKAPAEKHEEIESRLEAGEDFSALAKEYSADPSKEKGGDLGWLPRGVREPELDEASFNLKLGERSKFVATQEGWYMFQLLEREMRPLEEEDKNELQFRSLPQWLEEQKKLNQVESNLENPRVWRWVLRRAS